MLESCSGSRHRARGTAWKWVVHLLSRSGFKRLNDASRAHVMAIFTGGEIKR